MELTYNIQYEASAEDRELIGASMTKWAVENGMSFREVSHPSQAKLDFNMASLSRGLEGVASYSTGKYWDAENFRMVPVFIDGSITMNEMYWEHYPRVKRIKLLNHEIGHILTGGGHTPSCPSTMHKMGTKCGTEEIDNHSGRISRENIDGGWLSESRQFGLQEIIQANYLN